MTAIDDRELDIPIYSPICSYCRHLRWHEGRTCDAFPERDSIPLEIWLGRDNHRKPHPGDHGIQFDPVDTGDARRQSIARKGVAGSDGA